MEIVLIDKVRPNDYNPNKMDDFTYRSLVDGIKKDGFIGAVVLRTGSFEIIDGEHRWRAAKELGLQEIPAVLLDVSDSKARKLCIALNQKRGEFDQGALVELLSGLGLEGDGDYEVLGLELGIGANQIEALLQVAQDASATPAIEIFDELIALSDDEPVGAPLEESRPEAPKDQDPDEVVPVKEQPVAVIFYLDKEEAEKVHFVIPRDLPPRERAARLMKGISLLEIEGV